MNNTIEQTTSWHQSYWAMFIFFIPAATVVAGLSTVYIAFDGADPLVKEDYYKEGLGINRSLEKNQLAVSLGMQVNLEIKDNRFFVQANATDGFSEPTLNLSLIHSTLEGKDQEVELVITPAGEYYAQVDNFTPGNWNLKVAPVSDRWEVKSYIRYPSQTQAVFQ